MNKRFNVAVLGSYAASTEETDLAYELGRELSKFPINVISGGQKGVMLSLAQGLSEARERNLSHALIVGVLPKLGFDEANEFIDIAIPVGAPHLQNSVVPLSGDLVVAIGGSAGTLAEISFAWQFKKPIALLGGVGWSKKLGGSVLDSRRTDPLQHFEEVTSVVDWMKTQGLPICLTK